ncbi:NAD(P)/FAD-dependent oxidoreductase [Nocardioides sp. CPCC 205120]|uniref:NAD(P)/FAD-dependent oxidoreductase n=1 Tax=Nocardioides sp. CPCC 205120 TaxID=3406462 RepID=UPI003B50BBE2
MTVVVVGAGHGGVQAAASLRDLGYTDKIVLVDGQPHLPYQRPPLSKAFLGDSGGRGGEGEPLRAREFFDSHRVELELAAEVTGLRTADHHVRLADGRTLAYDHLVLATGATNRALEVPGTELDGVVELRTLADASALRGRLRTARNIVVIGGGFIGLEVAAVAAASSSVTVVEPQERVMARAVAPFVSDAVQRAHARAGVNVIVRTGAVAFAGDEGQVRRVRLTDGVELPADLVVVAVGVTANDRLALEAGMHVDNGIVVDPWLRTSAADVFAIGDCAARVHEGSPTPRRLECVQNAVDQARHVATSIVHGRGEPYERVPYFWTHQLDLRIQTVGLGSADDEHVVLGERDRDRFSVCRFRNDRLVAVESVNRPRDHMAARRILDEGGDLRVCDAKRDGFDLKEYAHAELGNKV